MKKAIVHLANGTVLAVQAPEDKDMAVDVGLLQHGVLSLGEYGPSGIKIAAFKDWGVVTFEAEGYTITEVNPF